MTVIIQKNSCDLKTINFIREKFNNLENHIINHEHTRSVIEDVDVAKVASELTTNEVIKKSAVAVLAQTADMPRNLTKLIS